MWSQLPETGSPRLSAMALTATKFRSQQNDAIGHSHLILVSTSQGAGCDGPRPYSAGLSATHWVGSWPG